MFAKDYYAILGISDSASEGDIRRSYRRLVLLYHPSLNKDPIAARLYVDIREAYRILSNRFLRRQYSLTRHSINSNSTELFRIYKLLDLERTVRKKRSALITNFFFFMVFFVSMHLLVPYMVRIPWNRHYWLLEYLALLLWGLIFFHDYQGYKQARKELMNFANIEP